MNKRRAWNSGKRKFECGNCDGWGTTKRGPAYASTACTACNGRGYVWISAVDDKLRPRGK